MKRMYPNQKNQRGLMRVILTRKNKMPSLKMMRMMKEQKTKEKKKKVKQKRKQKKQIHSLQLHHPLLPSHHHLPNSYSNHNQAPHKKTIKSPPTSGAPAPPSIDSTKQTKEIRKLRRHIIKLNTDLEATEREMNAQRIELERAATRMERDRTRHKQERDTLKTEHANELALVKKEYEGRLEEASAKHATQMEELRKRLERAEEMRAREGGEWNSELEEAVKRERHAQERVVALEDEKGVLVGQVSSLQGQITALESRLESSTKSHETASEREREAEDRLDSALTLHARQLGQRQAREAELERYVAELGAALVVARDREQNRLNKAKSGGASNDDTHYAVDDASLKAQLLTAEDELETVRAQLSLEQQRCQTLHQEVLDMAKEQTEEASAVSARQKQYDRQINDLRATVSRLESLVESGVSSSDNVSSSSNMGGDTTSSLGGGGENENELKRQISSLSDEVMRQRSKIDNHKGEVSTLKSRLRAAISRAEVAEKALTTSGNGTDPNYDIEGGIIGGASVGGRMKRRVKGGRKKVSQVFSIRSALGLQQGRVDGETTEQLGRFIDVIDTLSLHTGAFFRYNPIARGGFIVYILLLHAWAFCLVIFHAHSYEAEPFDSHGPHALLSSYRHIEQLSKSALIPVANEAQP
mmetsp:Transcript_18354/g.26314  ORF Transcript_18354/g.26314 Transcript_18354/m.26314 type:complete len:645 (+) Transcript_18354:575-2509(+)